MKKNMSNFIWGGLFILAGIFLAGKAFHLFYFNIFFPGWWTLFIIVPCFIGLFNREEERGGYIVGLVIGFFLLLLAQRIIRLNMFIPLCIAAILVYIGIKMIFTKESHEAGNRSTYQSYTYDDNTYQENAYQQDRYQEDPYQENPYQENSNEENPYQENPYQQSGYQDSAYEEHGYQNNAYEGNTKQNEKNNYTYESASFTKSMGNDARDNRGGYEGFRSPHTVCTAVFSGKEIRFDREVFQGAMLSAVLGGIELDLRNAIIRENVVIDAKAVLGGIDIRVPDNVKVVVNCTPILGGVDDRTRTPYGANEFTKTIYVNATCVLGGIDVK